MNFASKQEFEQQKTKKLHSLLQNIDDKAEWNGLFYLFEKNTQQKNIKNIILSGS